MTPEQIAQLPTPEMDEAEDRCSQCGLKFVSVADARSLEQRLAAAVSELKSINPFLDDRTRARVKETLTAIKEKP